MAHNLIRWTATLGQPGPVDRLTVARTMRVRLIAVPGRLVNGAGIYILRGPAGWPWAAWFVGRLERLRALRPVRADRPSAAERTATGTSADNPASHAGLMARGSTAWQ